MAPKPGPRSLVISVAVLLLLLAGCGNWWQQQERAARERKARELCIDTRNQVTQLLGPIKTEQQALARINRERYVPSAAPSAPDPAQANRFSQLDRELDQERFEQQWLNWRSQEQQRRSRWDLNQRERRGAVQERLDQHLKQLITINPDLVRGAMINTDAVARLSRCEPSSQRSRR